MNVSRPVNGMERLLKSLNCDGKLGMTLLAGCALLLLPVLAGDHGREALRYDRIALAAGQWWRLLTAHFVHLDFNHAALNSLGLVLMWALFARDYRPLHWLAILIGSISAIDAGLWLRDSTVAWYVGSSGALHGIMAAGTLAHLRRRDLDGWILAVFIVAKLAYEQSAGALPFTDSHSGVVVDAHLFGTLGGVAIAVFLEPQREPL
jgi:rhomboid family GlyGly-CTERM serine protease